MGRLKKISWYNHETKTRVPKWVDEDDLNQLAKLKIRKRTDEEIAEIEKNLPPVDPISDPRIKQRSDAGRAAAYARRMRWQKVNEEMMTAKLRDDPFAEIDLEEIKKVVTMRPTRRAEWVVGQFIEGINFNAVFESQCRAQSLAVPRFMLYCALFYGEGWGPKRIAAHCNRDHSTVIHGCKKAVEKMPAAVDKIRDLYEALDDYKEIFR